MRCGGERGREGRRRTSPEPTDPRHRCPPPGVTAIRSPLGAAVVRPPPGARESAATTAKEVDISGCVGPTSVDGKRREMGTDKEEACGPHTGCKFCKFTAAWKEVFAFNPSKHSYQLNK
jgi:hypothetical protein